MIASAGKPDEPYQLYIKKSLFFNEMRYENSNQSIFIMFLRDRDAWKKNRLLLNSYFSGSYFKF